MTTEKVKVLYIAGTMRSGSTLLGRLLAEIPEAVAVGELGLLFSPAFRGQSRCGCLQKVQDCDFWEAVFQRAFGGIDRLDMTALHETRQAYRFRTLPRLFLERYAVSPKTIFQQRRRQEYIQALDALYGAIREVSGARVIVDASKDPLYAYLLQRVPGVDLRLVHLVRDSRAVAFSQQRLKADLPLFSNPGRLPVVKPLRTALVWNVVNALLVWKARDGLSLGLRYEDFVADPEAALHRVWALMDEPVPPLDFLDYRLIPLHTSHTVAGNPDRFQPEVTILPDSEWQQKMPVYDRRLVTALTWPGLLHYRFLRPPPAMPWKPIRPSRVL